MASSERVRIHFINEGFTVLIAEEDQRPGPNELLGKEYCITDDALKTSDSVSFTCANIDGENTGRFIEGQKIEVEEAHPDVAGGAWCKQLKGIVTSVEYGVDMAGGSVVAITCMDNGWFLTSCDAPPLLKTGHGSLKTLLRGYTDSKGKRVPGLIDPSWGLPDSDPLTSNVQNARLKQGRAGILRAIGVASHVTAVLPFIQVEPGQKPMDVIGPYLTRLGILLNVGAKGELVFFQPNYDQAAAFTVHLHKSTEATNSKNNVLGRPRFRHSIDGLYSEVQCWSTVLNPTLVQTTQSSVNPNAQYLRSSFKPDTKPPFTRLAVFSDAEAIGPDMRKNRAIYKSQMDLMMSWEYTAPLQGHVARDASGKALFFTSDMMIDVDDTIHQVQGALWSQAVRKTISKDGTHTQVTLRLPILNPNLTAVVGGGGKRTKRLPEAKKS